MEYLTVSIIALIITTYFIYLTANKLFRIKLRVKPLILCAGCSLFISIVIPRLLAGVVGTLGTLSILAVCAVTFSYFLAYHDHFETKSVSPVKNPADGEEALPDLEPFSASEPETESVSPKNLEPVLEVLSDGLMPEPQDLLVESVIHESLTAEPPVTNESEPTLENKPVLGILEELQPEKEPIAVEKSARIPEVAEPSITAEKALPKSETRAANQPKLIPEAEPSLPEEQAVWEFVLSQTATNLAIDESTLLFEPLPDTEAETASKSVPEVEPAELEEETVWKFALPQTAENLAIDESALLFESLMDTEAEVVADTPAESELLPAEDALPPIDSTVNEPTEMTPETENETIAADQPKPIPEAEPAELEEETVWEFDMPQTTENLAIDESALLFEPLMDTEAEVVADTPAESELLPAEEALPPIDSTVNEPTEMTPETENETIAADQPKPIPEAEPTELEEETVWEFDLPQTTENLAIDESALLFEPLMDTEAEVMPEVALGSESTGILPDDVGTEPQEPEVETTEPIPAEEPLPEALPELLDDLLDYAFAKKETGQSQSALAAFTKAFELYKETNDAPFIIVELSNLLKNCGQYDRVIDVFTEGCTLQVIRQNQGMYEQFSEMIAFMKIIKQNLVDHQLGMIPYNQIPADLMHKINEDFHEWRVLR